MKLSQIIRKMARKGLRRNLIFCFSVAVGIALLGANGILQFSPTVTEVLVAGGSTHMISLGMYSISAIGVAMFLVYANMVYLKNKMGDVGVFLALGLNRNAVCSMVGREFLLLYGASGLLGTILSIPVSWMCWNALTLFLNTAETTYYIGWTGIWIALAVLIFMGVILLLFNHCQVRRADVMKILRSSSEQELISSSSFRLGVVGLALIPTGLLLFRISSTAEGVLGSLNFLFILVSVVGVFFLATQVTAIGGLFQRFFPRSYYRHLLFFNLIRQKGRQYTLSLFVSAILIAVTVFGISFNSTSFTESGYYIESAPYAYSMLLSSREANAVNVDTVKLLAAEYRVELSAITEVEFLLMGRQHQYADGFNEWAPDIVISESAFHTLTGRDVQVPNGKAVPFREDIGFSDPQSAFRTYSHGALLTNPALKQDISFTVTGGMIGDNDICKTLVISDLTILSDGDYQNLSKSVGERYRLQGLFFDTVDAGAQQDAAFYSGLRDIVVEATNGLIWDNVQNIGAVHKMLEEGKIDSAEDVFIPYRGNELYAARWWALYPFSIANAKANMLETSAVYLLLVSFGSLVTLIAATLIIGIKVMGTVWTDRESYRKASYLGIKRKEIGELVTAQTALLFFFPALCGCLTGVMINYQIVSVSSASQVETIVRTSVLLSLAVCVFQVIIFAFVRRSAIRTAVI